MFFSRNVKNIRVFLSETFQFLVVKCSIYLNRLVFVMQLLLVEKSALSGAMSLATGVYNNEQ